MDETAQTSAPAPAPAPPHAPAPAGLILRALSGVVALAVAVSGFLVGTGAMGALVLTAVFDVVPEPPAAAGPLPSAGRTPREVPRSTVEPSPSPTPTPAESPTPDTPAAPCDPNPRVQVQFPNGMDDGDPIYFTRTSTQPGRSVCNSPDVIVNIVTYWVHDEGYQVEHGGVGVGVPSTTNQWTPRLVLATECPGDVYVVAGSFPGMFAIIQAGDAYPVPVATAENGWRGVMFSQISDHVQTCATAPPQG